MAVNPYSSQSISGYNASPPPDDGSQTSANKVEWAKHINKIGNPIKTLSEGINTQAVSAFNTLALYDASLVTTTATLAESDWHNTIQANGEFAINFPDPATLEDGWHVGINNAGTATIFLQATATNFFIDETGLLASGVFLERGLGVEVRNTATVYLVMGRKPLDVPILTSASPAATDTVPFYSASATGLRRGAAREFGPHFFNGYAEFATATNVTTIIPTDDTIPTATEGVQILAVAAQPLSATTRWVIDVSGFGAVGTSRGFLVGSLFKDGNSSAKYAQIQVIATTGLEQLSLHYQEAVGSTATTGFSFRLGPNSATQTIHLNSDSSGNRIFGGVGKWVMSVREVP